jgi:hypothetical protein
MPSVYRVLPDVDRYPAILGRHGGAGHLRDRVP